MTAAVIVVPWLAVLAVLAVGAWRHHHPRGRYRR